MKYIICISRQYGSGGRFIAQKIAEKLNINFYDNELLAKVSEESGMSKAVLENYDEKKDGFLNGIIPSTYGYDISLSQRVFLAQFETIRKIGETESCVIVGRCADYILKDTPNVVSIFIHAPLDHRIQRGLTFYNLKENKAKDIIIKMDKKRKNYYNYYTDKSWGHAESYDLCINSEVGIEETADLIIKFVETKLKTKLL